jgi:hypothetical protein
MRAERMAGPTTVEVMAFPARSCNSLDVSVVREILFKGMPCRIKFSSAVNALPASEAKLWPDGVIHPIMPNGAASSFMYTFCDTSQMRVLNLTSYI